MFHIKSACRHAAEPMESAQFGSQLLRVVDDGSVVVLGAAVEATVVVRVIEVMGPVVANVVLLAVVLIVVDSAVLLSVLVVLIVLLVLLVLLLLLLLVLLVLLVLVKLADILVVVAVVLLPPIPAPTQPTEPALQDENDATLGPTNH